MKIENHDPNRLERARAEATRAEAARGVEQYARANRNQPVHESMEAKDSAALSENARVLAKARAALEELSPQERAERVEALRQQVSSGTYSVPIEALAEKFVSRIKNPSAAE